MTQSPRFSIIMPSRLADYKGAASNREIKILRAIDSALGQRNVSFELIVVADGCQRTVDIVEGAYSAQDFPISIYKIPQQPLWSGTPRNTGIDKAKGAWIIYLDIDDMIGPDHLATIDQELRRFPAAVWVYFNDFLALPISTPEKPLFKERACLIDRKGRNGTANICHQRSVASLVRWDHLPTYEHDWHFIRRLAHQKPYERIRTPQYYVCHYPDIIDI